MNVQIGVFMKKQKGATLFTALVFLALMTIVGVSAAKLSILDVLVAGNNEQQMRLFQEAENDLKELTTMKRLIVDTSWKAYDSAGTFNVNQGSKPHVEQQIISHPPEDDYVCKGFGGHATQIDQSASKCKLWDFQVRTRKPNTTLSDRHNRGGGKEKPPAS